MKVSIIIPIFNSENHLYECIDSAVRQTYDDIEIILVNDGSTDGSESICCSFADKDPRIVIINQQNSGVSVARNTGIGSASGDLITFIDSDDHVDEDYVGYLVGLLSLNDSEIACCRHYGEEVSDTVPRVITGAEPCLKEYLATNSITATMWGKIYKKQLFDNIRFPEGKRFEDNYVLFKLLDRCNSITIGNLKKYYYRLHSDSFVNEHFTDSQMDIIDAMMLQREFIEQKHPALSKYANARVVYAANRCMIKMADSGIYKSDYIKRLKPLYKKYGNDFLKGSSSRSAKRFSQVARISPKLAIKIYKTLKK